MRILEAKNYEEMSALAAGIIGAQVLLQPRCVLGLATGSSPIGTYEKLVEAHRAGRLDFSQVRTVNLDEYCGLSGDNPQSYRYFMEKHLFSQVNLPQGSTHLPNGAAPDMEAEARRYEALVESLGYADLQLLGIGHNGHIGFNEPCESFPAAVHPVELTESTIQANSRLFDRVEGRAHPGHHHGDWHHLKGPAHPAHRRGGQAGDCGKGPHRPSHALGARLCAAAAPDVTVITCGE